MSNEYRAMSGREKEEGRELEDQALWKAPFGRKSRATR
jgi:hypothetical protein